MSVRSFYDQIAEGEEAAEKAKLEKARLDGATMERARIVAFLREEAKQWGSCGPDWEDALKEVALEIESGMHDGPKVP